MHVVLYEPDIPGNTGNVGRSCVATGSTLHLVGKLGFSLKEPYLKRSGLDYWEKVHLVRHENWDTFIESLPPAAPLYFFSKFASRNYWEASYPPGSYLVFGCETTGLPSALHQRYRDQFCRIPMQPNSVRSLNLSTAVGVVLYEALRQTESIAMAKVTP
jgi:tRNA (cytidine/uridine-2'-O-)-methyltransferase